MLQAIVTKYLGPSNTQGARIKATCAGGSITRTYDYALDIDAQHHAETEPSAAIYTPALPRNGF